MSIHDRGEAASEADGWFAEEFRREAGASFALEPATAEHEPFLRAVFADTLAESLLALGADPRPTASGPLLELQYRARHSSYLAAHPLAHDYVVTRRADGAPVARFLVDWSLEDAPIIWGIDVAVHPARRGGAVGLRLLRAWVKTCDHVARPAQLHVLPHNPARRIYQRLGFVETEPLAFPLPMRREPRPAARHAARLPQGASLTRAQGCIG